MKMVVVSHKLCAAWVKRWQCFTLSSQI